MTIFLLLAYTDRVRTEVFYVCMNEQMKSPEAPVNPCAKHTGKILNNDKDIKNSMYRITSVANPDRKS